ncbi:MAG: CDP-alcohol phosphatidyltransferase family protein [Bryobacterales bacterium]|nr:CDP-alcohol phosphatidyltransferase family protein [Bryobacterales bacterium]
MAALAVVEGRHVEALWLVMLAGFSDGLDGFLARHFRWRTRLGSYLDPLADKLLLVLVFLALAVSGTLPWIVVVLFGVRDVWILAMVAYAWRTTPIREFPPQMIGKVTTVSQIILALTLLVGNAYPLLVPGWAVPLALISASALTAVSGVDYTVVALRRYRAWRESAGERP